MKKIAVVIKSNWRCKGAQSSISMLQVECEDHTAIQAPLQASRIEHLSSNISISASVHARYKIVNRPYLRLCTKKYFKQELFTTT